VGETGKKNGARAVARAGGSHCCQRRAAARAACAARRRRVPFRHLAHFAHALGPFCASPRLRARCDAPNRARRAATGEKKLRSLLATTLEWNSSAERARTVRCPKAPARPKKVAPVTSLVRARDAAPRTCLLLTSRSPPAHLPLNARPQAGLAEARGMVELGVALRSKRCACLRKPHFLFLAHTWRYSSDIWARKGQKRRAPGGGNGGGAGGGGAEAGEGEGGGDAPSARQSQRQRAKRAVAATTSAAAAAAMATSAAAAAVHAHAHAAAHAAAQHAAAAHHHYPQQQHYPPPQLSFPGLPPPPLLLPAPLLAMGTHVQPETAWLLIPSQLRPLTLEATQLLAGDQAHAASLAFGTEHISRDALEGVSIYRRECADAGLYFGTLHAACVRAHMQLEHTSAGAAGAGAAGAGVGAGGGDAASGAAAAALGGGGNAAGGGGVGSGPSCSGGVPQGDAEACLSGAVMPYLHRALGVYAGRVAAPGTSPAEAVWLTELHRAMALLAAATERAVAIMRGSRAEGATRSAALKVECIVLEWLSAVAASAHAAFLHREAWMTELIAARAAAQAAAQAPGGGGGDGGAGAGAAGAAAAAAARPTRPLVVPEELPREGELVPIAVRMQWRSGGGGGGGTATAASAPPPASAPPAAAPPPPLPRAPLPPLVHASALLLPRAPGLLPPGLVLGGGGGSAFSGGVFAGGGGGGAGGAGGGPTAAEVEAGLSSFLADALFPGSY
jgi:hypothetical protein